MKGMMTALASWVLLLVPVDPGGFSALFDGESLSGWTAIDSKAGNWRVVAGLLETRGDGKGWLSTNREYSDFELMVDYRLRPGGNSGILIRAPHRGDPSFDGIEIQILDDQAPIYRSLKPEQYTGSVYGVLAAQRGHARPPGEWNSLRIVAIGSRIRVELNGMKILEGDLSSSIARLPRHRGLARSRGFLGLQSHESRVEFRSIALREIKGTERGGME